MLPFASERHAAAQAIEPPADQTYESVLVELENIPSAQPLLPINLDVLRVSSTVLAALPLLRALQADLQSEIRRYDAGLCERLRRYTVALLEAHARYRATSSKRERVAPLASPLALLRKQLLSQARSMTYCGWVEPEALARLGKERGYRGLVGDVLALVALFRLRWADIAGHTSFTLPALGEAERLALELLAATGRR
ncbi:MAG: hypothetical protein RL033_4892, partial [Pseudomonadota bacterium]